MKIKDIHQRYYDGTSAAWVKIRLCHSKSAIRWSVSNFTSKIASHPESKAIISRILAGDQLKLIARDFGLSAPTLSKFRQKIIRPAALGTYPNTRSQVKVDSHNTVQAVRGQLDTLIVQQSTADLVARKLERYERILGKAEDKGDISGWASVDRAETAALQLQAQLRGEVNQVHTQTTVQMMVYTPQLADMEQEPAEVLEVEARAVEEIEAPQPAPELPAVKPPKPPKQPKPLSRLQRLKTLSAKDRQAAIRLIGQGIDPFAAPPPPPESR